jgi:hypothetical protein
VIYQWKSECIVHRAVACGLAAYALFGLPDGFRQEIAVRARHLFSLQAHFQEQKAASKPLKDAFLCHLPL